MGRKPKEQNIETSVEQTSINTEEQNIETSVELVGEQTIVGTGKSQYLKEGSERIVSAELAMCLIAKGSAKLK